MKKIEEMTPEEKMHQTARLEKYVKEKNDRRAVLVVLGLLLVFVILVYMMLVGAFDEQSFNAEVSSITSKIGDFFRDIFGGFDGIRRFVARP